MIKPPIIYIFLLTALLSLETQATAAEKVNKQEVLELLAKSYVGCKKHDQAIATYQKIIQDYPKNIEAHLELAKLYSWKKEYQKAIEENLLVLKIAPEKLEAMKQIAETYTYAHQLDQAELWYHRCIEQDQDDISLYIGLGEVLLWQQKYEEATCYLKIAMSKGTLSEEAKLFLAQSFLYKGDVLQAKNTFLEILAKDPQNTPAKIGLAESYAYNEQFNQAIQLYRELLFQYPTRFFKNKLAEVLSWKTEYKEAVCLYDQILKEKYDQDIHRQKARVLGWAQEYSKAIQEYQKILNISYNKKIELEMEAKIAYWGRRYTEAEKKYTELLRLEPDNIEARFDLSQVYCSTQQWQKAREQAYDVLSYVPIHFRAKDEISKITLVSERPTVTFFLRKFKAFSISRLTDINKRQSLSSFKVPLNDQTSIDLVYNTAKRWFTDYSSLKEKESLGKMTYLFGPNSWISGYWGIIKYNEKELSTTYTPIPTAQNSSPSPIQLDKRLHHNYFHEYGVELVNRDSDYFSYMLSFNKQRREDNALCILKSLFQRSFLGRIDCNLSRDFTFGTDYTYRTISDGNKVYQPGFDATYSISHDPERFFIKYRYFWMNYKKISMNYWSPQHLSTNGIFVGWRHYLNRGTVYFGMMERYIDLQYGVTRDTTHVVENRVRWTYNWEIFKNLTFNVGGSVLRSNHHEVYKENEMVCGIKYTF